MVPYHVVTQNINIKGALLIVLGGAAWLGVLARPRLLLSLPKWILGLIGLLLANLALSSLTSPSSTAALFGAPYVRLGTLGLAGAIGCGLLLRNVPKPRVLMAIYASTLFLAVFSVVYNLWRFGYVARLIGPVYQADALAAYLGVGLVLGFWAMITKADWTRAILMGQVVLLVAILLTQTRAAIGLSVVLSLAALTHLRAWNVLRQYAVALITMLLLIIGLHAWSHVDLNRRIFDANYAKLSVQYRYDLQEAAIQALPHVSPLGVGPGNIAGVLSCNTLKSPPLQQTCNQGFVFGSSHNIFLDRFIELGWFGGLAFLVLTVCGFLYAIRSKGQPDEIILAYVLLLLGVYFLTNVTTLEVELIFWICLLQTLPHTPVQNKHKQVH